MSLEAAPQEADSKLIIRLLSAIVVLLTLLVLGMACASLWAFTQLHAAKEDAHRLTVVMQELGKEGRERQRQFSVGLHQNSESTREGIAQLQKRRARLEALPTAPLAKVDLMLKLSQFLIDEQLELMQNTADFQRLLAAAVQPLPAKK